MSILGRNLDRVNLLSVGESQRVPALDLLRLYCFEFTSSPPRLSNVIQSFPDCQLLTDLQTWDRRLQLLHIYLGTIMLPVQQLLQISSGKLSLYVAGSRCFQRLVTPPVMYQVNDLLLSVIPYIAPQPAHRICTRLAPTHGP